MNLSATLSALGGRFVTDETRAWAQVPFGDSVLAGDPKHHLDRARLEHAFSGIEDAFELKSARLAAIVLRCPEGGRAQPSTAVLTQSGGLRGDRWAVGTADPGDQISMMNVDVAACIAHGQSVALFGDNLFTDLDLRECALPVGAEVQIGDAVLSVSATPHVPCDRIRARFGHAAFVMAARNPRIRGVYLTVIEGGVIRVGDSVCTE